MTDLRLALVQMNPTVGDLAGNAESIRSLAREAIDSGAHIVAFPEMALVGHPLDDLAARPAFVKAQRSALESLAADLAAHGVGETPVIVGCLGTEERSGRSAAAVLHRGDVAGVTGDNGLPVNLFGTTITVETDTDATPDVVAERARAARASLVVLLTATPYALDVTGAGLTPRRRLAAAAGCTVAVVNLVGAQDGTVFDGDSLVVQPDGALVAQGARLAPDVVLADLTLAPTAGTVVGIDLDLRVPSPLPEGAPQAHPAQARRHEYLAELWAALRIGLGDYVRKNGFSKVLLGVSGGIDSTLVATLAADALGGDRVIGVSNPSQYSTQHSKDDAADLCQRIGADYRVVPIQPFVDPFVEGLELSGLAEENVQARVRAVVWMALSNSEGALVLANSNKSEASVGYATMYGDSVGGYAPIKDVPKTLVWKLATWRNAHAVASGEQPPIPENTITKAPSAELRPDQKDEDSLPPYELLDLILERYVTQGRGRDDIIADGFDADVVDEVLALVDRAEWKRRQCPMGTRIGPVPVRDRRLPVTSRWRHTGARHHS